MVVSALTRGGRDEILRKRKKRSNTADEIEIGISLQAMLCHRGFCLALLAGDHGGGNVGVGNFCIHAIHLCSTAFCCSAGNARRIISIVAGVAQVVGMRSLVAMTMTMKLSLIVAPLAVAGYAASIGPSQCALLHSLTYPL